MPFQKGQRDHISNYLRNYGWKVKFIDIRENNEIKIKVVVTNPYQLKKEYLEPIYILEDSNEN